MDLPDPDALRRAWADMPAPSGHPSEEALLGYLENGAGRAALEAHLARCAACRETLKALLVLSRGPAGALPRRAWPWAVAAALLLVAGGWWLSRPLSPSGSSEDFPSAPGVEVLAETPAGPDWVADRGDLEGVAGRSVSLALRRGGALRVAEAGGAVEIHLMGGTLHLESPGEPVRLLAGGVLVAFEEAELAAGLEGAPGGDNAWLVRSALADEAGPFHLSVLSGEVRLLSRTLRAGQSVRVGGGILEEAPPVTWRRSDWQLLEGVRLVVRDAARTLLDSPPATGYVLEAMVRKRDAQAEMSLCFEALGRAWEVPVGANLLGVQDRWTRVRIEVGPWRTRLVVGGRELIRVPTAELPLKLSPRPERKGVGLRAWGGDLEIRSVRWRSR